MMGWFRWGWFLASIGRRARAGRGEVWPLGLGDGRRTVRGPRRRGSVERELEGLKLVLPWPALLVTSSRAGGIWQ